MEINNRRGRNKIVGGAMFENFSKIYNRGGGGGGRTIIRYSTVQQHFRMTYENENNPLEETKFVSLKKLRNGAIKHLNEKCNSSNCHENFLFFKFSQHVRFTMVFPQKNQE